MVLKKFFLRLRAAAGMVKISNSLEVGVGKAAIQKQEEEKEEEEEEEEKEERWGRHPWRKIDCFVS